MFGGFDIWASSHPLQVTRRHDSFPGPHIKAPRVPPGSRRCRWAYSTRFVARISGEGADSPWASIKRNQRIAMPSGGAFELAQQRPDGSG